MRILFVQRSLNPPGGGNLVACWMVEALRGEHQLTVLAWSPPAIDECNFWRGRRGARRPYPRPGSTPHLRRRRLRRAAWRKDYNELTTVLKELPASPDDAMLEIVEFKLYGGLVSG